MTNYTTIIWDWNGTLLNDRWLAIEVMNNLLTSRGLQNISENRYLEIFNFPVKDYYKAVGFDFDKEPFEKVGSEFIEEYNSKVRNCELHKHTVDVLKLFDKNKFNQYVLSARNQNELAKEFNFYNIDKYFKGYSGLNDHYANGKESLGKQLIEKQKIDKKTTVLIGDTVHDFEVAQILGIDSILVEGGHQSLNRLQSCNTTILNSLSKIIEVL